MKNGTKGELTISDASIENVIQVENTSSEQFYNYCYLEEVQGRKTYVTKLSVDDYLEEAFIELPTNANIDKGRCGIGGTSLEIKANRHTIFIVCTTGGILDKAAENSSIFAVHGKMKPKDIIPELIKDTGYRKIFVTPDSFWKIVDAAKDSIGIDKLRNDYFVLYDESHTAITEAWRPNVLAPLKEVWKFKNKSFITATPCEFTNPKFLELQNYRIEFHQPYVGEINIVDCKSLEIASCVDTHIANAPNLPGSIFIFYNSVTEISEAIKRNELTDCHIYCADKSDNYEKLPDQLEVFRRRPETGKYALINFFTTRYFECFDLWAKNATIILVTDTTKAHTRVGISNKAIQAVGRIRRKKEIDDSAYAIIHITNNRGKNIMKTRQEFRKDYEMHQSIIPSYNKYVGECTSNTIEPLESYKDPIKAFSDIDRYSHAAIFNPDKLDQVINELVCSEEFNSINFIADAWQRGKYKVTVTEHRNIPDLVIPKRISKASAFKRIIDLINELEINTGKYTIGAAAKRLAEIQVDSPLAFEAYYNLSMDRIRGLDYKEKAIKSELLDIHNKNAKANLLPLLDKEFMVTDEKFTSKDLTERLQHLYSVVGLKNKNKPEEVQKAYLADFEKNGWFKLKHCKGIVDGIEVRAYQISEKLFDIKD